MSVILREELFWYNISYGNAERDRQKRELSWKCRKGQAENENGNAERDRQKMRIMEMQKGTDRNENCHSTAMVSYQKK